MGFNSVFKGLRLQRVRWLNVGAAWFIIRNSVHFVHRFYWCFIWFTQYSEIVSPK